ncbi:putative efflux pump outer membrane protein TtgC precursor [bacterium BMS3Bbin14]|nr:putative efflux pump outer membrane protein TtgC precursor [bacterium BMS3Abin13]GBE52140.1 putative efflux pump outer membrane protein TtgC precursor [bacterium BMS3Bbin14]
MKWLFMCAAIAGTVAMALAGCTVGPDFHTPAVPATSSYTAAPLPAQTVAASTAGGVAQRFAFARQLSSRWWQLFRSPELDALIKRGLAQSPTLSAARAALRETRENFRAAGGALHYPRLDVNLWAQHQRSSGAAFGGSNIEYNLYNASVGVSYTLDLFGSTRRQLEGLQARVDYQRYQFEGTYLALTGNIVTTAIREAALREQINTTHNILAVERKQLAMVKRQFELGAVSKVAVLSQQSQLAITSAALPPLRKQLAFTRHSLAVLAGQLPSAGHLPVFRLDSLHLPEVLPVTLPSTLARQRPDIRAAEALLHQAGAAIGVATANLYPQITLSGSFGTQATRTGDLLTGSGVIWNIGAGLLQPLFHGGELSAKRRAAVAAYDQAAAQYRQTVLLAFKNVADVLCALDSDALTLQARAAAEAAVKANLDLTRRQFRLGAVNYLTLLVAQRDYQQARISLIAARAQRYADTAALFQALGGGWWNRSLAAAGTAAKAKMD